MNRLSLLFLSIGLPLVASLSISCSSTSGSGGVAQITKVTPYHLKPGMWIITDDPMIAFEQQHRLHGAITAEEYAAKFGHYFTIFWETASKGSDFTVRLEYTQGNTGPTIHTKEAAVSGARGKNATKIDVVGEEYSKNGPITSWKVTVFSGGQPVAESKSFLWK